MSDTQPNAFVIEVDEETAGLAVRAGNGFEFHAVSSRFQPLDGRRYNSLLHVQRAADQIRRGSGPIAPVAEARGRLQRLA